MPVALTQCNRDDWIAGVWTLMIGVTLLFSSVFGLIRGADLYTFASDAPVKEARLQEI
jgi:multisubunit Na+/H+ antiporter MnhG subunit